MEIKVSPTAPGTPPDNPAAENSALAQIRERGYASKYRGRPGKRLFELGLIFNPETRSLSSLAGEEIPAGASC